MSIVSDCTACKTQIVLILNRIAMPHTMEVDHNSSESKTIECHPFYKCIQPLIVLQKISGGWVHRPLKPPGGKLMYNAFFVYCLFGELVTIALILRSIYILTDDVSLQISNMHIFVQVPTYVALGCNQIMSVFMYSKILPFWDDLLSRCPQEFSGTTTRPKIIIWAIFFIQVSGLVVLYILCAIFIVSSEPKTVLLWFAQPWSDSQIACIIAMATLSSVLTVCMSWLGAVNMSTVAAYYLRSAFRRLYRTMEVDESMLSELASYKCQHLHLARLTAMLDDIFKGFIGSCVALSTYVLCIIIFTLKYTHSTIEIVLLSTSIVITSFCMAITTVFSISIHSWVSSKL